MTRAQGLLKKYEQMGISKSRILLRIPGTFEGIQAAKQLEAQGIQTHIILVYRCVTGTTFFLGTNPAQSTTKLVSQVTSYEAISWPSNN